ncbi:outer membrane beta-barrel family protein [Cellulophaga sp. HaHaR_3_176]|uniref:outer membrane beta-barrel family protein n=1 Tax=Cellulophaga sp. HaHaR_3_176 TaxID=1942464 RepID=UPI0020B15C35|nr:outer membrane beta-barrel family protein [Cellulophaga sp. HaHaR_3_176]
MKTLKPPIPLYKSIRFIVILFSFSFQYLSAQVFEIKGNVVDISGDHIPYANVFILSSIDSTVVKGSSADENGFFIISAVVAETYFLQASYVGKKSELTRINISEDLNIGTISITDNSEELDEVVLIHKQPILERKADRIIFNVENTVISQGSSWDILKKTPGVISTQDKLQIRNKDATVYLNNRKIQLSADEVKNLLDGFSGVNIKSIEVIHNPPAEFDADGGPVLNIITSKNIIPGYKGSINATYTQAILPKYAIGTSHYFKTDKLNVFLNYNINPRREFKKEDSGVNYFNNSNTIYSSWDTNFKRKTKSQAQNAALILDYDFNDKNSLNINSTLSFSPNKEFSNSLESKIKNGQQQLDSILITTSNLENTTTNFALDATFEHNFDKEGESIAFNGHITKFKSDQDQAVFSKYYLPNGDLNRSFDFSTNSKQDIQIAIGQVDFISTIGKMPISSGLKFSSIKSTSGIDYFNINESVAVLNTTLSDNFQYDEIIYAGYFNVEKDWEKWSLKAGVRGELTNVLGKSVVLNTSTKQNYFELFPSLFLLHSPSENNSFSFDYSRKLTRPKYQELNPFRYFSNENSFTSGNQKLTAVFSNNFNLNYSLKDTYFFDFYYRDNGKGIETLVFQNNQNQTIRESEQNVFSSKSYGLDFTYNNSITDKWFVSSYISAFSEKISFLAEESNNLIFTKKVEGLYAQLANYLTLSKDGTLTGELSLLYFSGFLIGSYEFSETTNLSVGLRKSLWNKKAVISITADDLFGNVNPIFTSSYLNQDNYRNSRPETQFVSFGFTYNFGNYKLRDNKKDVDKNERDRIE